MHRDTSRPFPVHPTCDVDVANFVGRTIPVGDDRSAAGDGGSVLAAITGAFVQSYFRTARPIRLQRGGHEHHLVRHVVPVLLELPTVQPHYTQRTRLTPHRHETMLRLRRITMRCDGCTPCDAAVTRLRDAYAVCVRATAVALQPMSRQATAVEDFNRWKIRPVDEEVATAGNRTRLRPFHTVVRRETHGISRVRWLQPRHEHASIRRHTEIGFGAPGLRRTGNTVNKK